jgi:molecular chaperone GrpE
MDDALRLAARQLSATRDAWPQCPRPVPRKWWARLLPFLHRGQAGRHSDSEFLGPARERLVAALTGLEMTLRRVERALAKHDLEPVAVEGRPFDPETMEVLEAVAANGRAPGEVVEEVRRGYRWRGRVFRCAQVRVAK